MYMQLIIYADLVYAEPQALTWHSCTNMEITVKMFLIIAWLQLDNKIKIYTLQKIQRRKSCMYVVVLLVMICDI